MGNRKNDLAKTLLYFDIFNYPLKKDEIWYYFHGRPISKNAFKKAFENGKISNLKSFYFIKGLNASVKERKLREAISEKKLKKAKKIINKLTTVPTVKFIGISGSLSMKNSLINDDIDIFVISSKGSVWFTRLLLIAILKFNYAYRGREDKEYQDKICLNLILGENKMNLEKSRQNIYSAHEVVQMIPIFQKDNIYTKFIAKNSWVKSYLPNYMDKIAQKPVVNQNTKFIERLCIRIIRFSRAEALAKIIQYQYMKNNITNEEISDDLLAFHPKNHKNIVLKQLKEKYKKFNFSLS